jgi:hypothetical protein
LTSDSVGEAPKRVLGAGDRSTRPTPTPTRPPIAEIMLAIEMSIAGKTEAVA